MPRIIVFVSLLICLVAMQAKENPEKEPKNARGSGKVYRWHAKDGLEYEYYVPKSYDPEAGATLLVSFHGSNLSKGWTFWNHQAGSFCKDRIIVSPDGTTPNQQGTGFNFLGDQRDLKRAKALIEEIRGIFNVTQTFLYGHSQGSFFIQHLVGAYPDLADGICAHASGVWTHTRLSKAGHRVAVGIMHGSRDPVVPYVQSLGARKAYREKKYPMVDMYTWFQGNHWPHAYHTERVIAWCEGMTSKDPGRVDLALDILSDAKQPGSVHWSALWQVAKRAEGLEDEELQERGKALAEAVEKLAQKHGSTLEKDMKKPKPGSWAVHLRRFLEDFDGVPLTTAFLKEHKKLLDKHEKAGKKHFNDYFRKRMDKPGDAFAAGVKGFKEGYLHPWADEVFNGLCEIKKDAKKHKISKKVLASFEKDAAWYERAVEKGNQAYEKVNRSAKLP